MQHTERMPLPHGDVRNRVPVFFIAFLLILAIVVVGVYYASERAGTGSTIAADWNNSQFLSTNPEMKVHLRYGEALVARGEAVFLAANPELIVEQRFEQLTASARDASFLASNPEFKAQRRYVELMTKR